MTSSRLLVVFALLWSALGCQSTAPSDNLAGDSQEGLASKVKAQLSPDGGASTMTADAGVPPTITETVTATQTATGTTTSTATQTYTATGTATATAPGTATNVVTNTVTNTVTRTVTNTTTSTGTHTTTGTITLTKTQTATGSKSYTATGTLTLTYTGTKTGTLTSSGAVSATKTATATASWTGSYLGTGTATGTKTLTGTLTGTTTVTGRLTLTATGTNTRTGSTTATASATASASGTNTQTYTTPATATGTNSTTSTGTATGTATATATGSGTHTTTATTTTTVTRTNTNTRTITNTNTVTNTRTVTNTLTIANPCVGSWAFCDNFETGNGAGWNVRQGPVQNFSVASDGTKVYSQSDSTASQLYISQGGSAWMDSTIEASLKPTRFSSSTSAALVTLWGHYDSTWAADCGYYVALRGDGKVALGKRVAGVDSALGSPVAVSGGIAAGTWYDVKLEFVGSTIKAYVGGTLLLTQTDSSCDAGSVGVGSVGASFEADDVRVTAPANNACVQDWRNTTCGAFCTYEAGVQSDRAGCGAYLDCYATHGCSPETCGGQDDVCGVNRPGLNTWGTASKEVADQVFKCLGCAGSVDCANAKYYNGTVCTDGNPCTWGDTCQNKVCVPDPNRNTQCSASDQCHDAGTCSSTTGMCSNPAKADGTGCDDGDACTKNDACSAGACNGTVYTCDDGLSCTSDVCNGDGTCTFSPSTGGCVIDGTCYAAQATNPGNQCQICLPDLSQIAWSAIADGAACDDGNACTQNDSCQAGVCQAGASLPCSASDQCHDPGVCDPSTGICSNPKKDDSAPCDDGNPCTQTDSCQDGTCMGASPVVCKPLDGCHEAGICDPTSGACSNPESVTGKACDDGNPCSVGDFCYAGECSPGIGVTCASLDPCHGGGVCDPQTGECSNPKLDDGTPCTTNAPCITGQTCKNGSCSGGNYLACGQACGTNGMCDEAGECQSIDSPTTCGPRTAPKPNEVIVWEDPNYQGTCKTLVQGRYPNESYFSPVHNDSISSLRVGCASRAILYQSAATWVTPTDFAPPFWSYTGHRATYEAGSNHDLHEGDWLLQLGPNVENDVSAIVVQNEDNRRVAYAFLGDHPGDSDSPPYAQQPQGLAHSSTHWFVTNRWSMFKMPIDRDLDENSWESRVCLGNLSVGDYGAAIQPWQCVNCGGVMLIDICVSTLPPPAGIEGCDHMGDPDFAYGIDGVGLVFVPMEGCTGGKAKVAVYRADDLSLVGANQLWDKTAGWVAIDPTGPRNLWGSDQDHVMRRYTVDWQALSDQVPGQPPLDNFLSVINCQSSTCGQRESWSYVFDADAFQGVMGGGQGGVFDPSGRVLYLTDSDSGYHGIMAVNPDTGYLLTKTGDNYGPFNFQREHPIDQEEEGIDYFDQYGKVNPSGTAIPGAGELHAILNFNSYVLGDGHVSIKHYTARPDDYCKHDPGDEEATLWSEANFQGVCRTFWVGDYPGPAWMYPMPNDWPSSLRVGKKVQVTIFENSNHGGQSKTIRGDAVDGCDPADDSGIKGQITNIAACGWGTDDHPEVSSLTVSKL